MSDAWRDEVLNPIEDVLQRWANRGDEHLVKTLLPAWRSNAGLTDGWAAVLEALRSVLATEGLRPDEAATIARVADRVERAIFRK